MAIKIPLTENNDSPMKLRLPKIKMPKIDGRFGLSLYIGSKEIFIGIAVTKVIEEQIIKKTILPIQQGEARVFPFEPLG